MHSQIAFEMHTKMHVVSALKEAVSQNVPVQAVASPAPMKVGLERGVALQEGARRVLFSMEPDTPDPSAVPPTAPHTQLHARKAMVETSITRFVLLDNTSIS